MCAALKIHLSESTAVILERLGGYVLLNRGQREVKVCKTVQIMHLCHMAP